MDSFFRNKTILITGGAGSLGQGLTKKLIELNPKTIRIFDNRESELFFMEEKFKKHKNLRFLIGDIRDKERLNLAFEDVDIVLHCAALKHVKSSEFNPFETIKTNIDGTQNVVDAALKNNIEKVIYTSSDKAVNPHNLMGATKLIGEKIITAANNYRGKKRTIFSSVRFGNVMGSNGSVIPLWKKQIEKNKEITITNPEMTRYMMSMDDAINLVLKCAKDSQGGEIFILKMPVVKLKDLADIMIEKYDKNAKQKIIGLKEGETTYEELMTSEEIQRSIETKSMYIITPQNRDLIEELEQNREEYPDIIKTETGHYDSRNQNPITKEELQEMLNKKEKVVAIIQARMGSERLPNKTLELIENKPMLQHIIERIKKSKFIDQILIATTTNPKDDKIEEFSRTNNIDIYRGDENDVLDRYYQAAKLSNASIIVRVTADDPFKDPLVTDETIEAILSNKEIDYVSNTIYPTYPEGIDIETFRFRALEKAWKEAKEKQEREHVTPYIWKNPYIFKIQNMKYKENISNLRWTVDYEEDLEFTREIYRKLYNGENIFLMQDILDLLEREPNLSEINKKIPQRSWYQ